MSTQIGSLYKVYEYSAYPPFSTTQLYELMRKISWCAITLIGCTWLVACNRQPSDLGTAVPTANSQSVSRVKNTLNRGLLGEPRSLDPQLADDTYSFQVIRDLYEGLTAEDRAGVIVPGAASSWTIDSTGTIYTFQLRPDGAWSDGSRVVADEFVQGLRRAVDPRTASGSAGTLSIIKGATEIIAGRKNTSELGVTALGNAIVQIKLVHPAPFILEILSQPTAAPLHANSGSEKPGDPATKQNSVTNGAYLLTEHVPGSFIELARNPHYWNAAKVGIDKVRYINAESEATELREYLAGELDLTFTIPAQDLERLSKQYPTEVQTAPFLGTLYLALNLASPPLKDNRDLRQALSMSVDREIIADRIIMGVTPAYSFVAQGVAGYKQAIYSWSTLNHDQKLAKAKRLYELAGYSPKRPLRLRLYFNQDEGIRRVMIAIAGSWRQNLGIESELISDEFRVFLTGRMNKSRWDVARLGWTADYDDPSSFLDVFERDSNQNDPGYKSLQFDELLNRAESEAEFQERMNLLNDAEKMMLEDYPIVPIYFYKARRLVKPYVGGAQLTPMNRTYTKDLFWKIHP